MLIVVAGARAGKSRVFAGTYSLWRALTVDLSKLAPGERASALIVAPDVRTARHALSFVRGAIEEDAELTALVAAETSDALTLKRGDGAVVSIEVLPATRGGSAVRGRWYVSAALDELAFFRDESAVVNDADVFGALAPRMLPGAMIVGVSTPWVEAGLLHSEFVANWATPTRAIAAHAPTTLLRPNDETREMVERERARDAANAEREYDAQFLAGGAGLMFPPSLLKLALDRELAPRNRFVHPGRAVVAGDLGLVHDPSAFVALHVDGDELVVADVLELQPKRGVPLKLSEVVRAGCAFAERHGQRTIHVDHHVLEPAREHLPEKFYLAPVPNGQAAKAERFIAFRDELRETHVRIPGAFARLAAQLGDVVAKPVPGGGTVIAMPRRAGQHGDLAAAAVIAAWVARRSAPINTRQPEGLRPRFASNLGGY